MEINMVLVTVLNEALVDELYEEGINVRLYGGLEFKCKNGYMTATVSSKIANQLIRSGRVSIAESTLH